MAVGERRRLATTTSALTHTKPDVREELVTQFARLGDRAMTAVPQIAKRLADQTQGVRLAASATLADLGPIAKDALPALKAALTDSMDREALNISFALWTIDPSLAEGVVIRLGKILENAQPGTRSPILNMLYSMREDATAAIPSIVRLARDANQPTKERIDSLVIYAAVAGQDARKLIQEIAMIDSNQQVATAAR